MKKVIISLLLCMMSISISYTQRLNMTSGVSEAADEVVFTKKLGFSTFDMSSFGMSGHIITVTLGVDGVSGTPKEFGFDFTGNGNFVSIVFMRNDPALVAGTYNIASFESAGDGSVLAGFPAMDGNGNWGSVWGTVADNKASDVQITGGVVKVSVNGGVYTIEMDAKTGSGAEIKAKFTGKLE